jgi:hypothetical protein
MAAAGSPFGILGIETMPAPRRPLALDDRDDPVRALPAERAVGRLAVEPRVPAAAVDCVAGVACVAAEGGVGGVPGAGGAVPQTSQ